MFEKYESEYFLSEALVSREEFHPLPKRGERALWDNVDEEVRSYYMARAEELLEKPVPQLTASDYMEYCENGNRTHFENKYHARRCGLRNMMIAECCENKGRFYRKILDYTYAVCDEFSWVVPAHNNHTPEKPGKECLPESVEPDYVDLFAAETASVLTWVYYFFEEDFDKTCRVINERIRHEVRKRILQPFLRGEMMLWMGYHGRKVNNWVPWILSNCIPAAAVFAEGHEKVLLMQRFLAVLDRFASEYKPDGGCDEGPHYWNAAGAALFDALQMLYAVTNGKINLYDDELVKNIGEYIVHAHLFDNVFINFADGAPMADVSAGVTYRYGKCIGSRVLTSFGAELFRKGKQPEENRFFVYRTIKNALEFREIKNAAASYEPEKQTYLSYLQVCASRDAESGLSVACKGGHNDESHNHNDIGTFMVYKNKKPIIIDPGCETYTAKTFSPERYTIWTMQSWYHNLPVIGGCMQREGEPYRAENVNCKFREDGFDFSLNVEHAYPKEAGVEVFERDIHAAYGTDGFLEVSDKICLKEAKDIQFYLTFADKPEMSGGVLCVNDAGIVFDHADYTVQIEAVPLTDKKMIADWNGRTELYRAVFVPNEVKKVYTFQINVR